MIAALFLLSLSATPTEPCEALIGTEARRALNERRRAEVFVDIAADEAPVVIVHQDAQLRAPEPVRLAGAELRAIDGERAVVQLDDGVAGSCAADQVTVAVDDSLGPDYQVIFVDEAGLLLLSSGGELAWWGLDEDAPSPEFELVWRSPFTVELAKPAPTKRAKKKKKRKRRRRRRR